MSQTLWKTNMVKINLRWCSETLFSISCIIKDSGLLQKSLLKTRLISYLLEKVNAEL